MTILPLDEPLPYPAWIDEPAYFPDPDHRAWLRRAIDPLIPNHRVLAVIGYNPSVANETEDDPTIRRCIGFAQSLNCGSLIMVNAATGIATDPDHLARLQDPVGKLADRAIASAAMLVKENGGYLVAAWGVPKGPAVIRRVMQMRFDVVRRIAKYGGMPLHAFRMTKTGYPEHPLYLPKDLKPQEWPYDAA